MDFLVENALKASEENKQDFECQVGQANIRVIGVGGAGNNMVGWLYNKGVKGAEIIACNTDQQHLNMINTEFKIILSTDPHYMNNTGMDKCEFYISTNMGAKLRPLSKIISGGEISRIMLAIKMALQERDIVIMELL